MRQDHFWNKRIPSLYGLGGIVVGMIVLIALTGQQTILRGNASATEEPKNIQITNITDDSFTLTYTTDSSVIGSISYGLDQTVNEVAFDERDTPPSSLQPHTAHSIKASHLKPDTLYYFSIKSGGGTYLKNGSQYQIKTGPTIGIKPSDQKPLTGKINFSSGSPGDDVLLYASSSGQILSTIVKNGVYVFTINTMRTNDLTTYLDFDTDKTLTLTAISTHESSTVQFTLTQDNTVPLITLNQNFDFKADLTPVPKASESGSLNNELPNPLLTATSSGEPKILTPKENAGFIDTKPVFTGTAPPDATIDIEIHSDEIIKSTIKANLFGLWSFKVPTNLSPGTHTITITVKDAQGIIRKITQSFVVFAEGTQVNQTATPSATLTPTFAPTPTNTPIPTVTTAPTIPPTNTTTPTPPTTTGTILISLTPVPTIAISITPEPTKPAIPKTGPESPPLIAIIGGILFIIGITVYYLGIVR